MEMHANLQLIELLLGIASHKLPGKCHEQRHPDDTMLA